MVKLRFYASYAPLQKGYCKRGVAKRLYKSLFVLIMAPSFIMAKDENSSFHKKWHFTKKLNPEHFLLTSDMKRFLQYEKLIDNTQTKTRMQQQFNIKYNDKNHIKALFCIGVDLQQFSGLKTQEFSDQSVFQAEVLQNLATKEKKNKLKFDPETKTISRPQNVSLTYNALCDAVWESENKYYAYALPSSSTEAFIAHTGCYHKRLISARKVDKVPSEYTAGSLPRLVSKKNEKYYFDAQDVLQIFLGNNDTNSIHYVSDEKQVFVIENYFFADINQLAMQIETIINQDPNYERHKEIQFLDQFQFLQRETQQKIKNMLLKAVFAGKKTPNHDQQPKSVALYSMNTSNRQSNMLNLMIFTQEI